MLKYCSQQVWRPLTSEFVFSYKCRSSKWPSSCIGRKVATPTALPSYPGCSYLCGCWCPSPSETWPGSTQTIYYPRLIFGFPWLRRLAFGFKISRCLIHTSCYLLLWPLPTSATLRWSPVIAIDYTVRTLINYCWNDVCRQISYNYYGRGANVLTTIITLKNTS